MISKSRQTRTTSLRPPGVGAPRPGPREPGVLGTGTVSDWTLTGAQGETVYVSTHAPAGDHLGHAVIVHGFLGYKDYGMFPRLASALASAGLAAHRVTLSHSGMDAGAGPFARPDLFENDTWNNQLADLDAVLGAIERRETPLGDAGGGVVMVGHSRGGTACLLHAGRRAAQSNLGSLAGVVSVSAPATCARLDQHQRREFLERGAMQVTSGRTGQTLVVGKRWLQEQLEDPHGHDLLSLIAGLPIPSLVVHGDADVSVDPEDARRIAQAIDTPRPDSVGAARVMVEGADHVFNTPNPAPADTPDSPQLAQLSEAIAAFARGLFAAAAA